ncbi:MAG: hypothetical protein ACI9EF_000683 [Pseudohongiellaceae bacterium]|jgi:hypothetical protein
MTYGLRSIAFVSELIHPPVQHDPRLLQKLHGELFGSSECSYRDFKLLPGGAQFSNAAGGMPGTPVSMVTFLADRIQVREEQTGASADDFSTRLRFLAEKALSALSMPLFMVQQFAVRTVINPQTADDARAFMLQTVFGFDESLLSPFPAVPSLAGMRFTFPPSGEDQAVYNVRVESFSQDNRSLFMENVGTFGRPLMPTDLDKLSARFSATYDFLQNQVVQFVDQFDAEGL